MKGQSYNNTGCDLYFPGPSPPTLDVKCPKMARMACYIFNGGVCCASECPGTL